MEGKIFDVVVDLRERSPTFSKRGSIELDSEDKRQLYYTQIESLEEVRNEILINYLNNQKTKSGGKKTKKLRNTKKKRRNKKKKSRKKKK